jgi:N-methylhydantoinase B/oxoprolinase/acetone carboxylase alpha subunit
VQNIPSKQDFVLDTGDVLEILTGGGGGYGDPLARAFEKIADDLIDRKITPEAAERDYAVIGNGDGIDVDASLALRETRRRERGPVSWTIDRGNGIRE